MITRTSLSELPNSINIETQFSHLSNKPPYTLIKDELAILGANKMIQQVSKILLSNKTSLFNLIRQIIIDDYQGYLDALVEDMVTPPQDAFLYFENCTNIEELFNVLDTLGFNNPINYLSEIITQFDEDEDKEM